MRCMSDRFGTTAATALVAVASLIAVPSLLAAAGFAPEKGQMVYVAATLKGILHRELIGGPKTTYDMAACERLVVQKANARKGAWTVVDLMGSEVRLSGTWQPWMFRTQDECRDAVVRAGEAPVKKSGDVYTLPTAAPPK
jgi:hypothetical protein